MISYLTDGPYVNLTESGIKVVNVNDTNTIIQCTGRSYPTPNVVWKKNGVEIQSWKNFTSASNDMVYQIIKQYGWDNKSNTYLEVRSILYIRPNGIKEKDHGNYTCEVLNANESSQPIKKTVEIQCKYKRSIEKSSF